MQQPPTGAEHTDRHIGPLRVHLLYFVRSGWVGGWVIWAVSCAALVPSAAGACCGAAGAAQPVALVGAVTASSTQQSPLVARGLAGLVFTLGHLCRGGFDGMRRRCGQGLNCFACCRGGRAICCAAAWRLWFQPHACLRPRQPCTELLLQHVPMHTCHASCAVGGLRGEHWSVTFMRRTALGSSALPRHITGRWAWEVCSLHTSLRLARREGLTA